MRFGSFIKKLRQDHSLGIDSYPKSLDHAYEMMNTHEALFFKHSNRSGGSRGNRSGRGEGRSNRSNTTVLGQQYAQRENTTIAGIDGRLIPHMSCYRCQRMGHYSDQCPTANTENNSTHYQQEFNQGQQHHIMATPVGDNKDNVNNTNVIMTFQGHQQMKEEPVIKQYFSAAVNKARGSGLYSGRDILLDTGSTCSVFNNSKMVINIEKNETKMRAYTNGGYQDSSMKGLFPGF